MPRTPPTACPDLTPAEFGAMKALWQLGSGSVADVRAHLASVGVDVAYTTVMTLLTRLAAKGAVEVERTREPFVYRAAFQREQILRQRLRAFVRDVFDGDASALVLGLVESDSISAAEAAEFERRIADAEVAPRGRASRKRGGA
jgi:BlaI family penicillinase repressor